MATYCNDFLIETLASPGIPLPQNIRK
jgi:hypothetical protein